MNKKFRLPVFKTVPTVNIKLPEIKTFNNDPLTIAYFTCRNDPKIEWFFRSLNRELKGNWNNIFILIIDYHFQYKPEERYEDFKSKYEMYTTNVKHVAPKPTPVQGKYKVTQNDYFAASNARNTAFVYCETPYIACIDDLTVLKNGWLDTVRWGQKNNFVLYGSYAKVRNLNCLEDGSYTFTEMDNGLDSRFNHIDIQNDFASRVAGSWLFGCSFAMPIDLAVNILDGFDEACDGMGFEDVIFGIRIGNATKNIYYSRQMFTYEDEDLHHTPGNYSFIRDSVKLTENTLLKNKIGIMSDHAILQHTNEIKNIKPSIFPSNLVKLREMCKGDLSKIAESFKDAVDWRNGELWCQK